MTGTVKFFNQEKMFGFIKDDDSDAEYFFHMKQCLYEPIFKNDKVSFLVEDSRIHTGKVCAVDVEKL